VDYGVSAFWVHKGQLFSLKPAFTLRFAIVSTPDYNSRRSSSSSRNNSSDNNGSNKNTFVCLSTLQFVGWSSASLRKATQGLAGRGFEFQWQHR
jgi:hypothetical protein